MILTEQQRHDHAVRTVRDALDRFIAPISVMTPCDMTYGQVKQLRNLAGHAATMLRDALAILDPDRSEEADHDD